MLGLSLRPTAPQLTPMCCAANMFLEARCCLHTLSLPHLSFFCFLNSNIIYETIHVQKASNNKGPHINVVLNRLQDGLLFMEWEPTQGGVLPWSASVGSVCSRWVTFIFHHLAYVDVCKWLLKLTEYRFGDFRCIFENNWLSLGSRPIHPFIQSVHPSIYLSISNRTLSVSLP